MPLIDLSGLLFRVMRLVYSSVEVQGLQIYYSQAGHRRRVVRALRVLRAVDPRRFRRLRECAPTIVAVHLWGGSSYRAGVPAIFLDVANRTAPESLAAALVHEGTHALLHRKGLRYEGADRARHENACVREELRFYARYYGRRRDLSARDRRRVLKAHETTLLASLNRPWWGPGAVLSRRWRDLVQSLRK